MGARIRKRRGIVVTRHAWIIGVAWAALAINGAINQLLSFPYDYWWRKETGP